jgi:NADP-reducing hydrogenase subunit HndB
MDAINSLEDLKRIREKSLENRKVKETSGAVQIIIGMGTCGIAVGARETMKAVLDYIKKNQIKDVSVTKTGCIGLCKQEPILQVVEGVSEKISYGRVSPEIAEKIMKSHVIQGNIFQDNVIQL